MLPGCCDCVLSMMFATGRIGSGVKTDNKESKIVKTW